MCSATQSVGRSGKQTHRWMGERERERERGSVDFTRDMKYKILYHCHVLCGPRVLAKYWNIKMHKHLNMISGKGSPSFIERPPISLCPRHEKSGCWCTSLCRDFGVVVSIDNDMERPPLIISMNSCIAKRSTQKEKNRGMLCWGKQSRNHWLKDSWINFIRKYHKIPMW